MTPQKSRRLAERGEGNLGNMIKLTVFALLSLAAYGWGQVQWANWRFQDRLTEIAGQFPPNRDGDARAMAAVEEAIAAANLGEYLTIDACSVTSNGGIGGLRTVTCTYDREYRLLPGMAPRTQHFEVTASRPMF